MLPSVRVTVQLAGGNCVCVWHGVPGGWVGIVCSFVRLVHKACAELCTLWVDTAHATVPPLGEPARPR